MNRSNHRARPAGRAPSDLIAVAEEQLARTRSRLVDSAKEDLNKRGDRSWFAQFVWEARTPPFARNSRSLFF